MGLVTSGCYLYKVVNALTFTRVRARCDMLLYSMHTLVDVIECKFMNALNPSSTFTTSSLLQLLYACLLITLPTFACCHCGRVLDEASSICSTALFPLNAETIRFT